MVYVLSFVNEYAQTVHIYHNTLRIVLTKKKAIEVYLLKVQINLAPVQIVKIRNYDLLCLTIVY